MKNLPFAWLFMKLLSIASTTSAFKACAFHRLQYFYFKACALLPSSLFTISTTSISSLHFFVWPTHECRVALDWTLTFGASSSFVHWRILCISDIHWSVKSTKGWHLFIWKVWKKVGDLSDFLWKKVTYLVFGNADIKRVGYLFFWKVWGGGSCQVPS